jgi:site-specific DNA-cytosine methylase
MPPKLKRPAASHDSETAKVKKRPAASHDSETAEVKQRPAASHDSETPPSSNVVKKKRPAGKEGKIVEEKVSKFLGNYVQASIKQCSAKQRANMSKHINRGFVISSGCTGSGMAEVVHAHVHEIHSQPPHASFSCEKVKFKRHFYRSVVEPHLANVGCCFEEMGELGSGCARCEVHAQSCPVPRGDDLFVCGFSCKDFSRLSGKFSADDRQNILQNASGSSGRTFRDLRDHLHLAKPKTFILENVDAFGEDDGSETAGPNVDFLYNSLMDIGYALSHGIFSSCNYGLPQRRRRVYFVGVHLDSFRLTAAGGLELVRAILTAAKARHTPCEELAGFIMPDTNPYVTAELARITEAMDSDTGEPDAAWIGMHKDFYQSKGINVRELRPPPELAANPWFKTLTNRSKEIVVYNLLRKDAVDGVLCTLDVSQTIHRTARGVNGTTQTLTPRMVTWLFTLGQRASDSADVPRHRVMLGLEALALQGFPSSWVMDVPSQLRATDPQLKDIAGNAFSATVFAEMYLMLLAHLPKPAQLGEPQLDISTLVDLMSG